MLKLLRLLIALLSLGLLTVNGASASAAVSTEKPASGSAAAFANLISENTRLSEEAVRENPAPRYDLASDSPVDAEGAVATDATSSLQGFRLSQQLAAEEAAGASAPTSISSWSEHALEQMAGRDGGLGVSQAALEDAFANPTAIQYAPSSYGPTFRYIGNSATVVVNPAGNVVTGWATSILGVP
jgi:filamentous hemagglutinin